MKKRISILLSAVFLFVHGEISATGYPVFDVTNWTAAIDRFYQGYDQIMNTLEIIEQNYQKIQMAYNEAKSWNLDEIDFNDGEGWKAPLQNLDIRDDIRDVTTSINKQMNNIRQIRDTFNNQNMSINGITFSMKDLLNIKGDKNIVKIMGEVVKMEKNDVKESWDILVNKSFTEEEKKIVWQKYGLTPANFMMVKNASEKMEKAAESFFSAVDDEVKKAQEELLFSKTAGLIDALYSAPNGEITEKQIGQVESLLSKLQTDELRYLRESLETAVSYTVYKDRAEAQKAEAQKETEKAVKNIVEEDKDVPDFLQ